MSDYDDYLDEPNRQQGDAELAEYAAWAGATHRNRQQRPDARRQKLQRGA